MRTSRTHHTSLISIIYSVSLIPSINVASLISRSSRLTPILFVSRAPSILTGPPAHHFQGFLVTSADWPPANRPTPSPTLRIEYLQSLPYVVDLQGCSPIEFLKIPSHLTCLQNTSPPPNTTHLATHDARPRYPSVKSGWSGQTREVTQQLGLNGPVSVRDGRQARRLVRPGRESEAPALAPHRRNHVASPLRVFICSHQNIRSFSILHSLDP